MPNQVRLAAAILALTLIQACATRAPSTTRSGAAPSNPDGAIYVISATHKGSASAALTRAGFRITDDLASAAYVARVTVGIDKSTGACGTLNNMKLALAADGQRILELQSAGWTGSCSPNGFDALASALHREFASNPVPDQESAQK